MNQMRVDLIDRLNRDGRFPAHGRIDHKLGATVLRLTSP
jgi:hypothetical protein